MLHVNNVKMNIASNERFWNTTCADVKCHLECVYCNGILLLCSEGPHKNITSFVVKGIDPNGGVT